MWKKYGGNECEEKVNENVSVSRSKSHADAESEVEFDSDIYVDNDNENENENELKNKNRNFSIAKISHSGNSHVYVDSEVLDSTGTRGAGDTRGSKDKKRK